MFRVREQLVGPSKLRDFAQIHNGYPVADMFDHGKIVGDEKIG